VADVLTLHALRNDSSDDNDNDNENENPNLNPDPNPNEPRLACKRPPEQGVASPRCLGRSLQNG